MKKLLFLVFLTGCNGGLQDAVAKFAEPARDISDFAEGCAVEKKQADMNKCQPNDTTCIGETNAKWHPFEDLLDEFHAGWCAVSPNSEECKR